MILPIWFLLVAFLTEVMAAVVGFGSSTLLTPLATFVFDIKTALAVVAVFHITGALVRFVKFRPSIDPLFFRQFGIPAVIAALAGSLLTTVVTGSTLLILLGLFLLLLVLYELSHPRFRLPKLESFEVLGGGLTGFFGGLLGAGGALRAASLQAFGLKKEAYVGTSAVMAVLVDATRLPVYIASGYLAGVPMSWIVLLMSLAVAGTLVGLFLIDRLPQQTFRYIVLGSVFVVALKIIRDGVQ